MNPSYFFTIEGSGLPIMASTNGIETVHVEGHGEVIPVPAANVKEFYTFTEDQKAEYLRLLERDMSQLHAIMNARSLKSFSPYEKVSRIRVETYPNASSIFTNVTRSCTIYYTLVFTGVCNRCKSQNECTCDEQALAGQTQRFEEGERMMSLRCYEYHNTA